MSNKASWIVGLTVLTVLASAVLAAFFVFSSPDLREHLNDKYSCKRDPEKYSSTQCTSSKTTDAVAKELYDDVQPIDRYRKDGKTFFQYEDDIVAIFPDQKGGSNSLIYIDKYEDGYDRHHTYIGHVWSAYRPSSSSGGK